MIAIVDSYIIDEHNPYRELWKAVLALYPKSDEERGTVSESIVNIYNLIATIHNERVAPQQYAILIGVVSFACANIDAAARAGNLSPAEAKDVKMYLHPAYNPDHVCQPDRVQLCWQQISEERRNGPMLMGVKESLEEVVNIYDRLLSIKIAAQELSHVLQGINYVADAVNELRIEEISPEDHLENSYIRLGDALGRMVDRIEASREAIRRFTGFIHAEDFPDELHPDNFDGLAAADSDLAALSNNKDLQKVVSLAKEMMRGLGGHGRTKE